MDAEAVLFATDESLQDLGLTAKGDIFAVKAFCQRQSKMHQNVEDDYEERKRKLVEELKKGRERVKSRKTKAAGSDSYSGINTSEPQNKIKKQSVKKRKITLGWMHFSSKEKRFITVRLTSGGGTRRVDVPGHSTKDDLIAEARKLFFPGGLSTHGEEKEMLFDLANFKAEPIEEFIEDGETTVDFTVQKYIEKHKLTLARLYLTSKPSSLFTLSDVPCNDDDDANLSSPTFDFVESSKPQKPEKQERGKAWRMKYANLDEDAFKLGDASSNLVSDDFPCYNSADLEWLDHSLLDTSEERHLLLQEQEESLQQSIEIDKRKEQQKKELLIQQDQEREKEERERARLEAVRSSRSSRVPAEPAAEAPRVRIAVHHVASGKLVRYFSSSDKMLSVYDWIGSLAKEPENFKLCFSPEVVAMPCDPVRHCTLYMQVTDESVLLLEDSDVTFKGYGSDQRKPENFYQGIELELASTPPDPLMLGDECLVADHYEDERVNVNYTKVQERREEALQALNGNVHVIVNKENIVLDLISIYKDPTILEKKVVVGIEGVEASGDGVLREVYSLFWDSFLSQSDGDSEHSIPIIPNLNQEDYVSVGRILSHQFVLCGMFPVKLSQASMQHALFGMATDECKIESFLRLLPPRERECTSRALKGDGPFPTGEIIDLLEDYCVRQLPTADNIKSLVLSVATAEFVTKPFLCLSSMREGMGQMWEKVTSEEIASLYEISRPTAAGIISILQCIPENPKEDQIFRWLERYLKGSSNEILAKFLRFCTATDVLLPGHGISVRTEVMPLVAIRPKSYTCFRRLTLPRNYQSYSQMRNNLDFYLRDCSIWDLND